MIKNYDIPRNSSVFKRLVSTALAVAIALLINLLIYSKTFTKSEIFNYGQGLCGVADKYNENVYMTVTVSAGIPFKSNRSYKNKTEDGSRCTAGLINRSNIKQFVATWPFYANWLIWSLPIFGISHIVGMYRVPTRKP